MTYNDQELVPFDLIKKELLELCKHGETGDFSLFTEEKHTAVISLYKGDIVGLWYRIAQGNEAVKLIKGIKKAKKRFHQNRADARPSHTTKIPSTVDVLIALGVELDGSALRAIGKKILVVEDSATQRKVICKMLTDNGYRTREAKDGTSALELLQKERPDLILLDIIMPGIDGYKVMAKIKEMDEMKNIPIIMLTSRDNLIDKMRGKISGTDEYLTKPFKSDQLIEKVNKYLQTDVYKEIEDADVQSMFMKTY